MNLDETDLIDQLRLKIKFIGKSAVDFDNGDLECAIEISTNIRALVHDTSSSNSLLNQLKRKNIKLFNTSIGLNRQNKIPQFTLVERVINPIEGIYYSPFLENSIINEYVYFNEWWNEIIVFIPDQGIELKRSDLVLKLANKYDAHIGTDIPQYYHDLFKAKDNMIGFTMFKNSERINHHQTPLFPSIRQIAHELVVSLRDIYKDEIDFDNLYFNNLPRKFNNLNGFSGLFIGDSVISDSMKTYERLTSSERNRPIIISNSFINSFLDIYPNFEVSNSEAIELFELLRPYNLTELDILKYCKDFKPFFLSYIDDYKKHFDLNCILNGKEILRVSVWINHEDYFIDNDPPEKWRVLRMKYNKLIKTAHN